MKNFILCFCILLGILAIAVGYYVFSKSFARMDAKFQNDVRQEYAVQNVQNRIQNYEWFYEQYETIKSTSMKAKLSEGNEKTAIIMILNDMIAEYNSRSKMTVTRAMWKSDSLPYQIDSKDFIEE